MSDAELDRHIADARAQFEQAYEHFERTGNPHDRDAALVLKCIFEDGCRERRARAGDIGFQATPA